MLDESSRKHGVFLDTLEERLPFVHEVQYPGVGNLLEPLFVLEYVRGGRVRRHHLHQSHAERLVQVVATAEDPLRDLLPSTTL